MSETIAITGGRGFLGWHTAARLRATRNLDAVVIGREEFADVGALAGRIEGASTILHLAGVNRGESDEAVEQGNVAIASTLTEAIRRGGRPVHVVNANSVQSQTDSAYGRGKARAADMLRETVARVGGTVADIILPNLFGEHGRPAYNSFVATFCHEIAAGRSPVVSGDREVPLLHAQGAAQVLLDAADARVDDERAPEGEPHRVTEVLDALEAFHGLYAERGEIPDLSDSFATDLFNTYRSYLFPQQFPIHPTPHTDPRGTLYETGRMHGGHGQSYVSTTEPGKTRGEHFHLRKVERFFVVRGHAEVALRRLLHDEVVTFDISGDRPAFVDMPTMWVHNIRNIGDDELVTMFWSDQLFDPQNPDQYPEMVGVS